MRIVAPIPEDPASSAKFDQKQTHCCLAILYLLWAKVFKSKTTSFNYFSSKIPKIYKKKLGHWTLGNGGKKMFKQSEQMKKSVKKNFCCGDFTPFMGNSCQIWDHFFQLLFPKDSENLNTLDIWLWEVGAKKTVKGVRNSDRQTNKQTNMHTDILTYRKNRPRGPIL